MKFVSLVDTQTKNVIAVDADARLLRLEIEGTPREVRLKPYYADILYALFSKHPVALGYDEITQCLRQHNLVVTDTTRMHRKLSEIRTFMEEFHPALRGLITNTRGVGYSLPLRLKNLQGVEQKDVVFKNPRIAKNMSILKALIEDAVRLTAKTKIVKRSPGYVMKREDIQPALVEAVATFNACEKTILKELRSHEAEFAIIRIQYHLARLRTYVGMSRISEYPISEAQWLDWFEEEVWQLFGDLQRQVREAEEVS